MLLALIVVPLIAFAVSRAQHPQYQASATVLVYQQNPPAAALNLTTAVASPPDRFAATQAALARVGAVAQMSVKAANVPHRTAAALLANSSVSASPTADLLTFTVTDPVPSVARKLATAYATQFTVYRHRLDTAVLSDAIAQVRRTLDGIVASGRAKSSPLFRRLSATYHDLEASQPLQAAGSSSVLASPAGIASLAQPKTRRNVLLGIIVGLALGIGLASLRESLDTRVHSADELRARLGLPLLGQVPKPAGRLAQAQQLTTLAEPAGSSAEAFRMLKTSMDVSQLQQRVDSIVITSTAKGEGKSTTAANLAVTLARSGRHVILVDLDLRHPRINRFFALGDRPGLTSVADGDVKLVDALNVVDVHTDPPPTNTGLLEIMTVGPPPPDPAEFLSSSFVPDALAALAARCDVLLIDTPPLLAAADAMTIATRADAVILVAGVHQVSRATLAETRRVLEACVALKLGFIATGSNGGGRYAYRNGARPQPVSDG
ncbi:MAG: polysaccharide biosynthesis tyrosine autokinase [Actinomycetota bacterium]|nr:polysaccharide biosynthesis tyrosine autokinase [Actinomycetota bacterium]